MKLFGGPGELEASLGELEASLGELGSRKTKENTLLPPFFLVFLHSWSKQEDIEVL